MLISSRIARQISGFLEIQNSRSMIARVANSKTDKNKLEELSKSLQDFISKVCRLFRCTNHVPQNVLSSRKKKVQQQQQNQGYIYLLLTRDSASLTCVSQTRTATKTNSVAIDNAKQKDAPNTTTPVSAKPISDVGIFIPARRTLLLKMPCRRRVPPRKE